MNDPSASEIGKEYGTALFALACEQEQRQECAKALADVRIALQKEPAYLTLLSSPSIPLRERLAAIEETYSGRVPDCLLHFLLLLCEKGRIGCFPDAAEAFEALNDAAERSFQALVTSAAPLTDEEKHRLTAHLEKRQGGTIRMEYRIDPSLLGGMVVQIDGKVIDGSLKHRLLQAKEVMK